MDIATILGFVLAAIGILVGQAMEGGSIKQIIQPTAALIVGGGTLGAILISFPLKTVLQAVKELKDLFFEKQIKPQERIKEIIGYAARARKEGIISLEQETGKIDDPFLKKALMMAIDGIDPKELRQTMELELEHLEEHAEQTPKVYEAGGGYSPTIGIIGAVLGLIQVMQHLDNIEEVGKGIAVAFVATIYGVAAANIFLLPAANKLKIKHKSTVVMKEMILEGVVSILEGLNPRLIEEKLKSFFAAELPKAAGEAGREREQKAA
jgi:chemotaxis protein MotA